MDDKKWKHAAWMAIGAAALTPANILLSFLADLPISGEATMLVLPLATIVATAAAALSLIALYRFRELLNERYDYHGIDGLVTFVIFAIAGLTAIGIVGRALLAVLGIRAAHAPMIAIVFVAPIILIGIVVGIVSIILGVKLFSLQNDLQYLIRPYAVISIIGGACFATIILAVLGALMIIAENVVLALLFLRAGEVEPTVDFV
ncbi:MAG: hypothetical protein PVJ49_14180 [Acidobacteriota bacterium]